MHDVYNAPALQSPLLDFVFIDGSLIDEEMDSGYKTTKLINFPLPKCHVNFGNHLNVVREIRWHLSTVKLSKYMLKSFGSI